MPNTRARIGKAQDTTSQSVAVFRRGASALALLATFAAAQPETTRKTAALLVEAQQRDAGCESRAGRRAMADG